MLPLDAVCIINEAYIGRLRISLLSIILFTTIRVIHPWFSDFTRESPSI